MDNEFSIVMVIIAIIGGSFWIGQSIRTSTDAMVSAIQKQNEAHFKIAERIAKLASIRHEMEMMKRLMYKQITGQNFTEDEE
jgi:hypothetical protein